MGQRNKGESFGSIARALSAEAVLSPSGRPVWQESTVRRICKRYAREVLLRRAADVDPGSGVITVISTDLAYPWT